MTAFKDIETQKKFATEARSIDSHIASHGFCPRKYYEELTCYMIKHSDMSASDRTVYWHKEVGADPYNVHSEYYQNNDGESVHISFEIAENLSERNKVHFGGSSPEAVKLFNPVVSRLRRLAKLANDDLQIAEDNYHNTPAGILDVFETAIYEIKDKMERYVIDRRRQSSYSQLQRSSGSDRIQAIYESHRSGMIGRIVFTRGTCGWNDKVPVEPTLHAYFEDPDIHAHLQEMIAKLEPHRLRFRTDVIEAWEQEKIISRLKGEDPTFINDVPF